MSDIAAELARVRDAFERPTLRLLDRKYAPLVLAVFRLSFSRDQRSITAERLHTQVDTYLEELSAVGDEGLPPNASGRTLCVQWMNHRWLVRTIGESGAEEYSLTSHALEALDLVASLSRERSLISESRINTILSAVRRMATEANPDRAARIERLDAQMAQISAERERLAAGGELAAASIDQMGDGYADILALIAQLPSDFKRVEESVLSMHRKIIADFRTEDRPIADVLEEYLRKTDELSTLTVEGRAFEGALSLLRDEALMLDLRKDLQAILQHPFARSLSAPEHRSFRGTVAVLRRGIDDVLTQRSRLSSTLRDHIVNHNVVRDRELDTTLRQINQQLAVWMQNAGPRAGVPLSLIPAQVDVEHLRERFYDPDGDVPPPVLEDVSDQAPDEVDLDVIRQQGGPSLPQLRRAVIDAIEAGEATSLSEVFNALPAQLRRPVEVLGLLHLMAGAASDDAAAAAMTEMTETAESSDAGGADTSPPGLLDPRFIGDGFARDAPADGEPAAPGPQQEPTRSPAQGPAQGLAQDSARESFYAVRPDGSRRTLLVPQRELDLDDARALAATEEGPHT